MRENLSLGVSDQVEQAFGCYTYQKMINKGADQTVQMHRKVCAFAVYMQQSHEVEL